MNSHSRAVITRKPTFAVQAVTLVALVKEAPTGLSSVNTLDVSEDRMWIDIGNGVPLID